MIGLYNFCISCVRFTPIPLALCFTPLIIIYFHGSNTALYNFVSLAIIPTEKAVSEIGAVFYFFDIFSVQSLVALTSKDMISCLPALNI